MSNPDRASRTKLQHASSRWRPLIISAGLRFIAYLLTGLISFLLGCVATVFVLFRVFSPPPHCPSPCDAPAYVALGVAMLVAPPVGLLFTGAGLYALSRLWRRKSDAAA